MAKARRAQAAGGAGNARRVRLDRELVRRGLARSRDDAVDLVRSGRVHVDGRRADKPATEVSMASALLVETPADEQQWASRGAYKLLGALDALPDLAVKGRRCLDAGASTGGFTDVLLARGASAVVAVDVGYGQLVWRLRSDPRVSELDRTNVRHLTTSDLASEGSEQRTGRSGRVDLLVADLSFISLKTVLPALGSLVSAEGDMLLMVKPQFEVGPARVGKGGVVREAAWRALAVREVAESAVHQGWGVRGLVTSPLPGPSGNKEYFVWFRRDAATLDEETATRVVASDGAWTQAEEAP